MKRNIIGMIFVAGLGLTAVNAQAEDMRVVGTPILNADILCDGPVSNDCVAGEIARSLDQIGSETRKAILMRDFAVTLADAGRLGEAARIADSLSGAEKNQAWVAIITATAANGDYADALKLVRKELRADYQNMGLEAVAIAYVEHGRVDEAVALIDQVRFPRSRDDFASSLTRILMDNNYGQQAVNLVEEINDPNARARALMTVFSYI